MISSFFRIPSYHAYLSPKFARELITRAASVEGVPGLVHVGQMGGLETPDGLRFLVDLTRTLEKDLARVLAQRTEDRTFIDTRVRAMVETNRNLCIDFLDPEYRTILGHTDARGRVVFGPLRPEYAMPGGAPIAPIPDYLQGPHVTLFGPPDGAKMAINAMNAYHRKLPNEPAIVASLLDERGFSPMWGADDEDSKTPLRADLIDAGAHLAHCFDGTLALDEGSKSYRIAKEKQSLPIKRFPGLALPSSFLFVDENPVPLHLYDFALHLFHHWNNPRALVFYVPKIENEEEAQYVHRMISVAEERIRALHPSYVLGTVRLLVVLENPRAIVRAHEIMDALYPYFAGASLGWHDYLASTARLFKEDSNYRIPVKADPNIVVKYIKASHCLVADVVGSRGGIKIGGMYGILPIAGNAESMQLTLRGFFKDVITQLKRDLSGFWVAHPDFVRIGIALVVAWKKRIEGDSDSLRALVEGLLVGHHREEILRFIDAPDVAGLPLDDAGYVRSLIVADIKQSDFVANDDPEEVRYNVFQSLQYLADWLGGNGCVALPTTIDGVAVRVMDDLATAERSRWEVWHEVRHGRVSIPTLLRIVHEEMNFIRRGLSGQGSDKTKIVQVAWNERTAKWYPIAKRILLRLMTDASPAEFATELLMPFTVEHIRAAEDPWKALLDIDPAFDKLPPEVADFDHYFELCGAHEFAEKMSATPLEDPALAQAIVLGFTKDQVIEAASFHGDIGQNKATLDARAASEQAGVTESLAADELRILAAEYKRRFGFKYLVSAKGRSTEELLAHLRERIDNSEAVELRNACHALWEITRKRMESAPRRSLSTIEGLLRKHGVASASIALSRGKSVHEFVVRNGEHPGSADVDVSTAYQIASLSKTIGSALALELLQKRGFTTNTSVHAVLASCGSTYRLSSPNQPEWADRVTIADLMRHTALDMHYVKGIPAGDPAPRAAALLDGNNPYGYEPVRVVSEPGTTFKYSGGGYLVLESLLEAMEGRTIAELLADVFPAFVSRAEQRRAPGYFDSGEEVPGGALQFPALAAGLWATAGDMTRFLQSLTVAYRDTNTRGISHDTAVQLLCGRNVGSRDFMGCDMGLGVFVAEAGANRWAIHQGANEGFRAIYVFCFDGPDCGKGFTIFCNGDNRAVAFVAEAARELLLALDVGGIDLSKLSRAFDFQGLAQEQIVNLGYKQLLFAAFEPDLPEAIAERGMVDPLAARNVVVGAKILSVTNQKFARAENLLSDREPVFDPELFGRQGKIMDSWESARHNPFPCDVLELELREASTIRFVQLSTKFHDGNQPEFVAVKAWDDTLAAWIDLVPRVRAKGHALYRARIDVGRLRISAHSS
jgi:malate synthase